MLGDTMINILGLVEMYNTFNKDTIYHLVAKCLLENLDKVDQMTHTEIAELCNVSQSTLSRFYKMMSYPYTVSKLPEILKSSKKNFQVKGAYYHQSYQSNASMVDQYFDHFLESISKVRKIFTDEKLEGFLEALKHSSEVVFIGTPMLQTVWRLQVDLFLAGYETTAYLSPTDQSDALSAIGDSSMVIYLNFAASPDDFAIDHIKSLRDRMGSLVVISNCQRHLLLEEADYSFHFDGSESEQDYLLMSMIINVLSSYVHEYL